MHADGKLRKSLGIFMIVGLALGIITLVSVPAGGSAKVDPMLYSPWAHVIDGTGNGDDAAVAVAVNPSDDAVTVAGSTWNGATGDDLMVINYLADGTEAWRATYDGVGDSDTAADVAADSIGNAYVTGYTTTVSGDTDVVTIKYNSSGGEEWAKTYDGPANGHDGGAALFVSDIGDVYVTGYETTAANGKNMLLIKYDSSGVFQWASSYDGPTNGDDQGADVVLDSLGYAYVAGFTTGVSQDFALVQFDGSGTDQWTNTYDGASQEDGAFALAQDSSRNLYVTGYGTNGSGDLDIVTRKVNSSGTTQWTKVFAGDGDGDDVGYAISLYEVPVDADVLVYVTGKAQIDVLEKADIELLVYDQDGTLEWSDNFAGAGADTDAGYGLGVDASGDVFVTGNAYRGGGMGDDVLTMKYTSVGAQYWTGRYNGTANGNDQGNALVVDSNGDVVVAGFSTNIGSQRDFTVIKYAHCTGCVVSIEGQETCVDDQVVNPDNECQKCDVALDRTDWTGLSGVSCNDGEWCTGDDTCVLGECSGHVGSPCHDDGLWCNGYEFCVEEEELCAHSEMRCLNDGVFCNGQEYCNEFSDECATTGNPCNDDEIFCNGEEECVEETQECISLGDPCDDDGLFCNGLEICDPTLDQCVSSGDPCDDGEECDEADDSCGPASDDDDDTPLPDDDDDAADDDDDDNDSADRTGNDDGSSSDGCCG